MPRIYSYVFTWNNYDLPCIKKLLGGVDAGDFTGIAFSRETAPTTGTLHLQGFAQSATIQRFTSAKRKYGGWWAVMRGSILENTTYINKQSEMYTAGTFVDNQQGKRTDLETIATELKEGMTMYDCAMKYPGSYVRYHRGFDALRMAVSKRPPARQKDVLVFYGPPGTGKSHYAYSFSPDVYRLQPSENTLWWTGYNGETVVWLDEFTGSTVNLKLLLQWLDIYPVRVHTAAGGSSEWLRATTFIITSNFAPDTWYPNVPAVHRDALLRRITKCTLLETKYVEPSAPLCIRAVSDRVSP